MLPVAERAGAYGAARKALGTMTPEQKKLHEMAQEKLGSSYFVERSKGFLKWKEQKSDKK